MISKLTLIKVLLLFKKIDVIDPLNSPFKGFLLEIP